MTNQELVKSAKYYLKLEQWTEIGKAVVTIIAEVWAKEPRKRGVKDQHIVEEANTVLKFHPWFPEKTTREIREYYEKLVPNLPEPYVIGTRNEMSDIRLIWKAGQSEVICHADFAAQAGYMPTMHTGKVYCPAYA